MYKIQKTRSRAKLRKIRAIHQQLIMTPASKCTKKSCKSSSNVLSRNTPAHTKAQGNKSMKKLSLQTIEPQGQYASRNMLITKEDYQAPRQEGERTVKLTEYQKKELLKQKQTVTRLKDEKSQILVRIREIASEDKETSNAIYEIEKEVQALTKTLTNLGAAAAILFLIRFPQPAMS